MHVCSLWNPAYLLLNMYEKLVNKPLYMVANAKPDTSRFPLGKLAVVIKVLPSASICNWIGICYVIPLVLYSSSRIKL